MKCPCCQEYMEKGILQANGMVTWVKESYHFVRSPKKGEVVVGQNEWGAVAVTAFICKACKIITLDYTKSNYQEK